MYKFWSAIQKEALMLWSDKVGLLFMFVMPLLLVTVVTIVQDSAFQLVNKNRIKMLVVNHDDGAQGDSLISLLSQSGMFGLHFNNDLNENEMIASLKKVNALTAISIPENFSLQLENKARIISQHVLHDFGIVDGIDNYSFTTPRLNLYYDPILQESFTMTISNILEAYLYKIENSLMLRLLYADMEIERNPDNVTKLIAGNRVEILSIPAKGESAPVAINASQHNVPAWTIFAMFFMVISLGGNIVKEKVSGSFVRLKTMPSSILWPFSAKMILYLMVAVFQVIVIFSFGATLFEYINLPLLEIPQNWVAFAAVVLISGLAAVSYAMLIGIYVKTPVQANGLGAISIIIFAALGGIWVPVFMMPDYLQNISWFSPLRQSLDAFYTLFLNDGNWNDLWPSLRNLLAFILLCQVAVIVKIEKLL